MALLAFLFYILRALPGPAVTLGDVSGLLTVVLLASVPATFVLAALADRTRRRAAILVAACVAMAVGLCALAGAGDRWTAFAATGLFGLAAASFLALQSGYAMLLLPTPGRHGRGLGLLNFANTLPKLAAPGLALLLVARVDFRLLLPACAGLALAAAALVTRVRWTAGPGLTHS